MSDLSMSENAAKPSFRLPRFSKYVWALIFSGLAYSIVTALELNASKHIPKFDFDLTPLLETTLAVKVHTTGALLALVIGLILLSAPKGFRLHKTLGWAWVTVMCVTAVSSFFITAIFQTHYSPIHAISAWVVIGLPMGIAAVRRRNIKRHREIMTNMFVGGMLVAGVFTMLPGRMMWDIFFS